MTVSKMKKAVWSTFAQYIKYRDAQWFDGELKCRCVTCGVLLGVDEPTLHAGHFLDSRCKGILFDDRGVHSQCASCNVFKHGNKDAYWPFMLQEYGQEVIDQLTKQKHANNQSWTIHELRDTADLYENLLAERKKQLEASRTTRSAAN